MRHAALGLLLAIPVLGAGAALPRQDLTYETLLRADTLDAPVGMAAFQAAPGASVASQRFSGRLSFPAGRQSLQSRVLHDPGGLTQGEGRSILRLPAFDFDLIQSGDALIPLRRGSLPSDDPRWEYLLEPGRVWQEDADRGLARAALPFTLQERNANCMHHGVLTFLFGAAGQVSQVAFQISSETCRYLQFDLWGLAQAAYVPAELPGAAGIVHAYENEERARLPVKPIAELRQDYPGADPEAFGAASEVRPQDMTAYGFLIDGVHYAGACATRHGPYPYCDVLDLPSYSLAKSIFAGVALMRLEQRFPGTSRLRIADFVPACAQNGRWDDVTFSHALDMATGNYLSPDYDVDESADHAMTLFDAETHAGKIDYACGMFPRQSPPGSRFVYHTSDTYVLGSALSAWVRQRLGPQQDLYRDVMVQELWQPLGLSPVTALTRRTNDDIAQPFTGWGLALHRDDILRIAHWLATGEGMLDDRQLLEPRMLAAALQRDPDDRGLVATGPRFRYRHGFWAYDAGPDIGCAEPAWVPFLSGYGGITVALFPNGTVYYYFSDGGAFAWRRAAIESDRIRSFCTRPRGTGTPAS